MAQSGSSARAWIGTGVFLFLAPGIVAGFIPMLISGWRPHDWGGAAWVVPVVWIAIVLGVAFLLHAFALFALHRGTPAPVAPTETLVVTGAYRFVRNPMAKAAADTNRSTRSSRCPSRVVSHATYRASSRPSA